MSESICGHCGHPMSDHHPNDDYAVDMECYLICSECDGIDPATQIDGGGADG